WASMISNVRAINLDRLPSMLEPMVWAIDDWNRNYKLGVIFECAVGDGKLLVSAIDVSNPDDLNPVTRQLRYSLMNYMATECFQPNVPVTPAEIRSLLFDTQVMKKLGATAQIDGTPASQAIDGNPNSFILAGDPGPALREQVELVVNLNSRVSFSGVVLMPRQNHREHEGEIRDYVIGVSDDGNVWNNIHQGELVSSFEPKKIQFTRPATAKYLKLISLSGFGGDKMTSLAEIAIIPADSQATSTSDIEYQRSRTATAEIDEGTGAPKPKPSPSPRPAVRKP
ncbi:MAG TPA: discoidin domain-containing protein, partial [Pyrinomonadaceae bacterium]